MSIEPDDGSDELRGIERDVLLAPSAELSPWGRMGLRRRLARDPQARRLAESLSLLSMATESQRGTALRRLSPEWGESPVLTHG